MTAFRSVPWAGPPLAELEPGAPGYRGNAIFGARWDAPAAEGPPVWTTPVGVACYACNTPIAAGDRGFLRGCAIRRDPATAELLSTLEPVHTECEMLTTIGHYFGVCSCTGYDTSSRSAALALLDKLNASRARDGHGPL